MLTVRLATSEDSRAIFDIAASESVRRVSFTTKSFSFAEHQRWFDQALTNPSLIMLVGLVDEVVIGYLRLVRQDNQAEISIALGDAFIGQGYGSQLLWQGVAQVKESWPMVTKLIAQVKQDNEPSQRFFGGNHFRLQQELFIKDCPAVEYCYELSD